MLATYYVTIFEINVFKTNKLTRLNLLLVNSADYLSANHTFSCQGHKVRNVFFFVEVRLVLLFSHIILRFIRQQTGALKTQLETCFIVKK